MIMKEATKSNEKFLTIQTMAAIAVLTALTCVLAPLAITIPISPVPISLTNLVIYFGLYVLGWKRETVSYIIYLLIGLVGLPVFSGGTAGPAKLLGPTGGYLIGFIFMTVIAGIMIDKFSQNMFLCMLGMILGTAVCYAFGTAWLAYEAHMTAKAALAAGVLPFIPGDLGKMILAMLIGPQIRKALTKAGIR